MDSDDDEDDSDEDDDEYVFFNAEFLQSLHASKIHHIYLPKILVRCTNNIRIHFIRLFFLLAFVQRQLCHIAFDPS